MKSLHCEITQSYSGLDRGLIPHPPPHSPSYVHIFFFPCALAFLSTLFYTIPFSTYMTLFWIMDSRISLLFSVKVCLDDSIHLRFPQILSLFSWKILCLLNPALEIPLYLSKATLASISWIVFLALSFWYCLPWFPNCLVSLLFLLCIRTQVEGTSHRTRNINGVGSLPEN